MLAATGAKQMFVERFDFNEAAFSRRSDGWTMQGYYRTLTTPAGGSQLEVRGALKAPYMLQKDRTHKASLFIGSREINGTTEEFKCGQSIK